MTPALSARQHKTLQQIADGLTTKEVAYSGNYSVWTVKEWRRDLYRLLGARNGAHAVAIAYQKGLLTIVGGHEKEVGNGLG